MDFCLRKYRELLECLIEKGYTFQSVSDFIENKKHKIILLRHDIDLRPKNALKMAELEKELGINGVYFFRMRKGLYNFNVIDKIRELGNEIGYHYETIDKVMNVKFYKVVWGWGKKMLQGVWNKKGKSIPSPKVTGEWNKKDKGIPSPKYDGVEEEVIDKAYELFCEELEIFRKDFDVKTVCMHGSPWSEVDNKLIWKKYNYKDLGIIFEPYYDLNWDEVGYLTDTGRRWNGFWSNLRDRVKPKLQFNFKMTDDIIKHIDKLNDRMMITVHPQRWNDSYIPWVKELMWQNAKNVVKKYVVRKVMEL